MSHNTFGDVNTRPHHTEIYDPSPQFVYSKREDYSDPLTDAEAEGDIDLITHELTDDRGEIFHEPEPEDEADYRYEPGLRKLAREAARVMRREGYIDSEGDAQEAA